MDKSIRRNEVCVIGLPRCDFVFSSTRTCFIAYGFEDSPLEMKLLSKLLEARGIQPVEAGGSLAPAQSTFCAKICSKTITSQFCIVLLNNAEENGQEIPNANVNMEYGLMIGFNKYVIPFQKETQKLPFNVAGLDTVKYTNTNFEEKAVAAIDQAISETQQDTPPAFDPDQVLEAFLLAKKALVTPLTSTGDTALFQLGRSLGFNLLNDFAGMKYKFLGNFTSIRPEAVIWRLRTLCEIVQERQSTLRTRADAGLISTNDHNLLNDILTTLEIWVVVTGKEDKGAVSAAISETPLACDTLVYSLSDVEVELSNLAAPSA